MTTWQEPRCKVPAALCRKIAELPPEGGEIEVWGDGHQVRTFLNIKDCCETTYRLMYCSDKKYYALGEIGKSRPPVARAQYDFRNYREGSKIRHVLSKPQGIRSRSVDLTTVKDLLDWEHKYSLRDTMEELYPWVESEFMRVAFG